MLSEVVLLFVGLREVAHGSIHVGIDSQPVGDVRCDGGVQSGDGLLPRTDLLHVRLKTGVRIIRFGAGQLGLENWVLKIGSRKLGLENWVSENWVSGQLGLRKLGLGTIGSRN
jgi:hypothetical protein